MENKTHFMPVKEINAPSKSGKSENLNKHGVSKGSSNEK